VTDVETTPSYQDYREHYLNFGFQTAWSVPFYRDHDVIGTFASYHKYKKQVTHSDLELVQKKVKEYQ
jgi:hypothetical protein